MHVSIKTVSFQVLLYLVIQCLCVWILNEARVNPSRKTLENKAIQRRAHRSHKSCKVGSNEPLSDDPCDTCRCVNGIARCHKQRCHDRPIHCVDAIIPEDACCPNPVCPNGANCMHDGEKINGRKQHRHRDYSTGCIEICACPPAWKVTYTSDTQAECREHCPIRRQPGSRAGK